MNNILQKSREFLSDNNLDYIIVNSNNEFLQEYTPLDENSRYMLTNFSGSTGDALLSQNDLYLFVDGRYHAQADLEVDKQIVEVVKLNIGEKIIDKLVEKILPNSVLGIVASKISQYSYENLSEILSKKNVTLKLLDTDVILPDNRYHDTKITELSTDLCGKSSDDKFAAVAKNLESDEAILVTNSEEISYFCNIRDFSKQFSCSVNGKLFITNKDYTLFCGTRLNEFESYIEKQSNINKIYADKLSVNARDWHLLKNKARQAVSVIRNMKSQKSDAELEHYKKAFENTDKALLAVRDYIEKTDNLTEHDISERLIAEFYKNGAVSLSFKPIVAIDSNSALAHYSKSSPDVKLNNGSIVLIDCGAYYDSGLATDITRVFINGEPSQVQKNVYTSVLKAFLHAYNYDVTPNTQGYEIDSLARKILAEIAPEGFSFSHGLGHGIGVSVHEAPPNLGTSEVAKITLKENMCFTIEPGLYKEGFGGVRLENSCYLKDGKINSFTNMCFEKKLIDEKMLTSDELQWLKEFELR